MSTYGEKRKDKHNEVKEDKFREIYFFDYMSCSFSLVNPFPNPLSKHNLSTISSWFPPQIHATNTTSVNTIGSRKREKENEFLRNSRIMI